MSVLPHGSQPQRSTATSTLSQACSQGGKTSELLSAMTLGTLTLWIHRSSGTSPKTEVSIKSHDSTERQVLLYIRLWTISGSLCGLRYVTKLFCTSGPHLGNWCKNTSRPILSYPFVVNLFRLPFTTCMCSTLGSSSYRCCLKFKGPSVYREGDTGIS